MYESEREQGEPIGANSVQKRQRGGRICHRRGLLPASPTTGTLVHTPAEGSWGVRCLTYLELFQAYDIGDRFIPHLPGKYDLSLTTPVSMVVESLRHIASLIGLIRGGKFSIFGTPSDFPAKAMGRKRGPPLPPIDSGSTTGKDGGSSGMTDVSEEDTATMRKK